MPTKYDLEQKAAKDAEDEDRGQGNVRTSAVTNAMASPGKRFGPPSFFSLRPSRPSVQARRMCIAFQCSSAQTVRLGVLPIHRLFQRADELTHEVIAAAIEVHRVMGPGLLESIYEKCLIRELELPGIAVACQDQVRIEYKGPVFVEEFRFDLLVAGCLLLELKAVQALLPIHKAQLPSYMKLLDIPVSLLFNFHQVKLVDGLSRLVLHGADQRVSAG